MAYDWASLTANEILTDMEDRLAVLGAPGTLAITSDGPAATYANGTDLGGVLTSNGGPTPVVWTVTGTDAGLVTLNASTGVWSLPTLDYATKSSYSFTFTATDEDLNTDTQAWAFSVVNQVAREPGVIVVVGDSISSDYVGHYNNLTEAALASDYPGLTWTHEAVSGSTITGANPVDERLAAIIALQPSYVTIFLGANDIFSYASGAAYYAAMMSSIVEPLYAGVQDIRIALGTVLPRSLGSFGGSTTNRDAHNTNRAAYNTLLQAGVGTDFDELFDFAADATMGPDAAASNLSLYPDGLHPADSVHLTYMKPLYEAAVEELVGYNWVPQLALTKTNAAADPVSFSMSGLGYMVGYYWQIQMAADADFTVPVGSELAIRDEFRIATMSDFTDDDLDGTVEMDAFATLTNQGTGNRYVRMRAARQAHDGLTYYYGPWSNTINENVGTLTATQFDTVEISPRVTLSNGDLTARTIAQNVGNVAYVRSENSRTGKRYFEITIDEYAAGTIIIGICDQDWNCNTDTGIGVSPGTVGVSGIRIAQSGQVATNGTTTNSVTAAWTQGDTVCVAFDESTGKVWFGHIDPGEEPTVTWNGDPVAGTGGFTAHDMTGNTWYAYVGMTVLSTSQRTVTANFGATAFTGTLPSGFSDFT